MFSECFKLKSLKLSNFDTSNVIDMHLMFHRCESLTSIDLSTFDTKNVNNMDRMFYRCEAILSLDLSNFNTSRVENIDRMFEGCISLTSLNLSNFDTSKINNMSRTFYNCNKLEYLNLKNFKNELNVKNEDFYITPENIVICTYSEHIINIINSKHCSLITCDENWKEQQKKINTENNECINDCSNINYKYLYGSKCINNCPMRTFNNNYICEDCHEDCNICNKESLNNNLCITCNNKKGYYPIDNDISY